MFIIYILILHIFNKFKNNKDIFKNIINFNKTYDDNKLLELIMYELFFN
jgi:hypothetical protein